LIGGVEVGKFNPKLSTGLGRGEAGNPEEKTGAALHAEIYPSRNRKPINAVKVSFL